MTFEDGNWIMQWESQGHREKGKEEFYIVNKIVKATSLNAFICEPIANKKNYGAEDKEAKHTENPVELRIYFLNVHGRDT